MRSHLLVIALLFLLGGCVTKIEVERVPPGGTANGMIYYLPKPLLVVKPQGDGTMEAHFEFVPDPANAYAINSDTLLGKHTMNVELTPQGLLKKLNWKPDATLITEGIKAASAIRQAEITKEIADEKAAEAKQKEKKSEVKTKLDAAKTKLAAANTSKQQQQAAIALLESELKTLEHELSLLESSPVVTQTAIDALELEIRTKEAERDRAAADSDDRVRLQDELDILQFKMQRLLANTDTKSASVKAKQLEIFKKKEELGLALAKLTTLENEINTHAGEVDENQRAFDDFAAANIPTDSDDDLSAWGPVTYEIFEGRTPANQNVITLRPVSVILPDDDESVQLEVDLLTPFETTKPKFMPSIGHGGGSANLAHPIRRASVSDALLDVRKAEKELEFTDDRRAARLKLEKAKAELNSIIEKELGNPVSFTVVVDQNVNFDANQYPLCVFDPTATVSEPDDQQTLITRDSEDDSVAVGEFLSPVDDGSWLEDTDPLTNEEEELTMIPAVPEEDDDVMSEVATWDDSDEEIDDSQTSSESCSSIGFIPAKAKANAIALSKTRIEVTIPNQVEEPGRYEVTLDLLNDKNEREEVSIQFLLN